MSVTRPSQSSNLIRSPIRIGCETAIWIPATRLAIVCWAAKPTISPSTAVEARTPVARRLNSVNCPNTSIATMTNTARKARRRRMRSRVRVVRETCETAGDMEANLTVDPVAQPRRLRFPYANWGGGTAVLGVFLALGTGVVLGVPAAIVGHKDNGDLTTLGNVGVQLATALGFLMVPMAIAAQQGAKGMGEILRRLGVRRFQPSAFKWMAAAVGAYLLFALLYSLLIVEPKQKDIAEGFGAIPVQVLLIVIAAPISEEVCFRGMLFGGLRRSLPRIPAALLAGLIFGGLHALTGVTVVPPLIAFGFILCLLYEKTGSIVPGIMLHMLNNVVALLGQ